MIRSNKSNTWVYFGCLETTLENLLWKSRNGWMNAKTMFLSVSHIIMFECLLNRKQDYKHFDWFYM